MKTTDLIRRCPKDEEIETPPYIGHRRSFWWVYIPCGLAAIGLNVLIGASMDAMVMVVLFAALSFAAWSNGRTVNTQERWAYRAGFERGWLELARVASESERDRVRAELRERYPLPQTSPPN